MGRKKDRLRNLSYVQIGVMWKLFYRRGFTQALLLAGGAAAAQTYVLRFAHQLEVDAQVFLTFVLLPFAQSLLRSAHGLILDSFSILIKQAVFYSRWLR